MFFFIAVVVVLLGFQAGLLFERVVAYVQPGQQRVEEVVNGTLASALLLFWTLGASAMYFGFDCGMVLAGQVLGCIALASLSLVAGICAAWSWYQ